jgi:hypothetical protein
MTADGQREVDHLRLEPQDLAAQDVVGGLVVVAHPAEQLGIALVATEDGIGQVEEDDRGLGEPGVALVLETAHRLRVGRAQVQVGGGALAGH